LGFANRSTTVPNVTDGAGAGLLGMGGRPGLKVTAWAEPMWLPLARAIYIWRIELELANRGEK